MSDFKNGQSQLANNLDIETVKWNLPINVLTCNPFNASMICSNPISTTFVV